MLIAIIVGIIRTGVADVQEFSATAALVVAVVVLTVTMKTQSRLENVNASAAPCQVTSTN